MASSGGKVVQAVLERLRKRRTELRLSQAQVAGAAKVNPSYIGLLERGERVPSLDVLLAMCEAVELTPAELFADASPKPHKDEPEISQLRSILSRWPAEDRQAVVRVVHEMARLRATR